jgi:hypothetical protein
MKLRYNYSEFMGLIEFRAASIDKLNDLCDRNCDYVWECTDDIEDEAKRETAQMEIYDSLGNAFFDAALTTAEAELEKIGLSVVRAKGNRRKPDTYQFRPVESWRRVAEELRRLVNGYGIFHFSTLSQFCEGSTYRKAAMDHIHWLRHYGEVYGDGSMDRTFERELSNNLRYL